MFIACKAIWVNLLIYNIYIYVLVVITIQFLYILIFFVLISNIKIVCIKVFAIFINQTNTKSLLAGIALDFYLNYVFIYENV